MFKQFDFPGFEEWRANGAPTLRIGDYYASITCDCSKDNIKTYTCSLSTHYLPFNKYVPKIFSMNIRYLENKDNVKLLEEWYNTAIQALNEAFVNHLKKNYYEDYIECPPIKVVNYPYQSGLCDNCQLCRKDICTSYNKPIHLVFICKNFIRDYD